MLRTIPDLPNVSESVYLVDSGARLANQLPIWFNTDPNDSLLGKVINIFSEQMNNVIEAFNFNNDFFPGKDSLYAPRQAHVSNLPFITDINSFNHLEGWFQYPDGNYIKLIPVSSLAELSIATVPCYFIIPEDGVTILIRNLEYVVTESTGTASGSLFVHSPGQLVEDAPLYERTSLEKDINLWNRMNSVDENRIGDNLLLEDEITYLYSPLASRLLTTEVTWVVDSVSATTLPIPVDLSNCWDSIARKLGISRLEGESNVSLRLRCLSVLKFTDSGKHTSLLGFCRDLGLVEIYEWDGTTTLSVPTGTIELLIATTPSTSWKEESLSTAISGYWSVSVKDWTQALIYSEGVPVEYSSITEGLISLNETVHNPKAKLSFEQWEYASYTLTPRNLPYGDYIVVAIQDVTMRTTKNIAGLIDGISLTSLAKDVVNMSLKVSTYRYGAASWGLTEFAEDTTKTAKNTFIPLRFID